MPINPFRAPANYDMPNFPAPAGRYDPSVFTNIASIGDAIAGYRDQQAAADIGRQSIGPDGKLDINKFVSANVLAGRNPIARLKLVEDMRHQREAEGIARTTADAAKTAAGRRAMQYVEPDPISGRPGGWRIAPDPETFQSRPFIEDPPYTSARPPPAVAPQSALPSAAPH